ncbi:MAG: twin-arginine translocation signal protein [Bacteroidetes bacterium]|jgi:hypothetical protein|nr:twin-arginine translocation signal protein [Bacteroidota bacterium]
MNEKNHQVTHRRNFINALISAGAAIGLSTVTATVNAASIKTTPEESNEAEKWMAQIKGKHKMVFDWTKHNNGAIVNWALTLMNTYNSMGISDKDLSVVIVMRYAGTPTGFADHIWEKYSFGKKLDLKDPATGEFTLINPYAKCKTAEENCIERFIKRGGMVCICNESIKAMSEGYAAKMELKKEDVYKEFISNLVPGIQPVPAGIWALNRSQELGCTFCFGG